MAEAGYNVALRRGGAPVSTTSLAFSNIAGDVYQVTTEAFRCLDPRSPWHLKDSAGTVDFADISAIDFLFGEITVSGISGALTYYGDYIPLTTASEVMQEVKSYSISESSDLNDTTVFSGSRYRKRIYGLADASITLDGFLSLADEDRLTALQASGAAVVVEVRSAATPRFRAWAKVESVEKTGSVEGVLERSVTFQLDAQRDDATGFFAAVSDRSLTS
jgi:hypothetical protein